MGQSWSGTDTLSGCAEECVVWSGCGLCLGLAGDSTKHTQWLCGGVWTGMVRDGYTNTLSGCAEECGLVMVRDGYTCQECVTPVSQLV